MLKTLKHSALGLTLLALVACGGNTVKETLGLERKAPDEFRVVSRPPLSVPPDFTLRPPQQGAEDTSLSAAPPRDKAASLVLGSAGSTASLEQKRRAGTADTAVPVVSASPLKSNADEKFLSNAGASAADPSIREKLHTEARAVSDAKEESSFIDKLLPPKTPKDPKVDAKAEAERIRKNKDEKKPITAGETPTAKQNNSVLGKIFGKDDQ